MYYIVRHQQFGGRSKSLGCSEDQRMASEVSDGAIELSVPEVLEASSSPVVPKAVLLAHLFQWIWCQRSISISLLS